MMESASGGAGYARSVHVSDLDSATAALWRAGCRSVHKDTCSGRPNEGEDLLSAIKSAGYGGTLVVVSVGHLTEFFPQWVSLTGALARVDITLCSLGEGVDDTTATGRHTLARALSEADYIADVAAGEDTYAATEARLPRWEERLAAAEAAVVEAKDASVTIEDLEAELDRITDASMRGEISTWDMIRDSGPLCEKIRAIEKRDGITNSGRWFTEEDAQRIKGYRGSQRHRAILDVLQERYPRTRSEHQDRTGLT